MYQQDSPSLYSTSSTRCRLPAVDYLSYSEEQMSLHRVQTKWQEPAFRCRYPLQVALQLHAQCDAWGEEDQIFACSQTCAIQRFPPSFLRVRDQNLHQLLDLYALLDE